MTSTQHLLVGVFLGVLASFLGFLLQQAWKGYTERQEALRKYKVCLEMAKVEVLFYLGKFEQLSGQLKQTVANLPQKITFPSYTLYPSHLERAKLEVVGFQKNARLIHDLTHCHFELCHISERLNLLRTRQEMIIPPNVQDLRSLVQSNIPMFQVLASSLDKEIQSCKLDFQDWCGLSLR